MAHMERQSLTVEGCMGSSGWGNAQDSIWGVLRVSGVACSAESRERLADGPYRCVVFLGKYSSSASFSPPELQWRSKRRLPKAPWSLTLQKQLLMLYRRRRRKAWAGEVFVGFSHSFAGCRVWL